MGFLAAACGSSPSSGQAAQAVQAPAGSGGTVAVATAPASDAVTIATTTGPLGTYLVDQSGRTLYVWDADTTSASTCAGACLTYWPPVAGAAKAGRGVQQSSLGTGTRSSGGLQVTYDSHPLYYYAGDGTPGSTGGQGNDSFGATWWVVGTDGRPITTAATDVGGMSGGSGY
jgi:predicted lipoprotein with Yx(FWY)xxD motif